MDVKNRGQILRVAKLYYELGLGQLEIARRENISKSTVSRMLQTAKDIGLIEIRIKDSVSSFIDLETQLLESFPLQRAIIVPDTLGDQQVLFQDVCAALVKDLPRYVQDGDVVGVAWGRTLAVLAQYLPSLRRKQVTVIQLSGGYSKAIYESGALGILKAFTAAFAATGYQIPAPAMADTPAIAEVIKSDSQIAEILTLAEACDLAIFSVGDMGRPSIIYEMGCLTDEEYQGMITAGAVGDCCSHFIDARGEVFDLDLDARAIAAPLATIKVAKRKLLIASGIQKAPVIKAALTGGLADNLYIDAPTAAEVVRLCHEKDI